MDVVVALWDILDVNDLNEIIREPVRRRNRADPLQEIPDREFKARFRFSKDNVLRITDMLRHSLIAGGRGHPFSPEEIVCLSLDILGMLFIRIKTICKRPYIQLYKYRIGCVAMNGTLYINLQLHD